MPPRSGLPDSIKRPEMLYHWPYKPPLPTLPLPASQQAESTEVKLPPLIAGSLSAAFSKVLADGLENELLTYYYLGEQKFPVNLDRVLDRLLAEFTRELWGELYQYYQETGSEPSRQVTQLFEGPIRQLILIWNGPEVSKCILDKLAPGLSQRKQSWSLSSVGNDLPMALQLLCSFWHREMSSQSPGGSPYEIARKLHTQITTGTSAKNLIAAIRNTLMSPHYVQVHINESAMWNLLLKKPFAPPPNGHHVAQFKFDCQLFGPLDGIADPQLVNIGSLPAITGTAEECVYTTVSEYVDKAWPKRGSIVLKCLEEALRSASLSLQQGESMSGLSIWDESDQDGPYCPGLRLVHVELENAAIRLTVSGWAHTTIDIFQQVCWLCATLSASPFPGAISECVTSISDWTYSNHSVYVNCGLEHRPVPEGEGAPWLQQLQGAAIASGFPVRGFVSTQL
ncbi:RNA binding effector protein Scp160 [Epichloe bromicola]|uniref:RNA binding effector protein Scp160 n=1 Tax=Epichloe bromicola TaxID=79588 RepID=A0ABQ0CSJ3_9HYPO